MATFLARVPLDEINTRARGARFGRVLLTAIAALFYGFGWASHKALGGVFYGIGWVAAKAFGVARVTLAWVALAVKVGWMDAGGSRGPS